MTKPVKVESWDDVTAELKAKAIAAGPQTPAEHSKKLRKALDSLDPESKKALNGLNILTFNIE